MIKGDAIANAREFGLSSVGRCRTRQPWLRPRVVMT
jgi:hypothetical protein